MATHQQPPTDGPTGSAWVSGYLTPGAQWLSSTRMLSILLMALAMTCLAWSAWPLLPHSPRALDLGMGVPLTLLAIGLLVWDPKLSQPRLFVLLFVPLAALGVLTGTRVSDTGVAILASGWVLLAVTAALYLTGLPALIAALTCQTAVRVVATSANTVEDLAALTSISLVATMVVAVIVFILTDGHRRLIQEVSRQAICDPLTGVLNRRGADLEANAVRAVAERTATPTTVTVLDVDDFKKINDRYGHQRGDQILQMLTDQWRRRLRTGDVLARIGGDEFMIVMPDTDLAAAEALLRRLHVDNPVDWTSGTAPWPTSRNLDEALADADVRLYAAKSRRQRAQ